MQQVVFVKESVPNVAGGLQRNLYPMQLVIFKGAAANTAGVLQKKLRPMRPVVSKKVMPNATSDLQKKLCPMLVVSKAAFPNANDRKTRLIQPVVFKGSCAQYS